MSLGLTIKFNRWFIIAWLLPLILTLLTLGISLTLPNVEFSGDMEGLARYGGTREFIFQKYLTNFPLPPFIILLLLGLIAGGTINAIFGFGEEIGWRGFLQREFQHLGFWKSSALIGFIWGIWHTPLILAGHNYPQHPYWGVLMMIGFCLLLSPILSLIKLKTNSVIAASIFHGSLNGVAGISVAFAKGGNDLLIGLPGLCGLSILLAFNILIYILKSKLLLTD